MALSPMTVMVVHNETGHQPDGHQRPNYLPAGCQSAANFKSATVAVFKLVLGTVFKSAVAAYFKYAVACPWLGRLMTKLKMPPNCRDVTVAQCSR